MKKPNNINLPAAQITTARYLGLSSDQRTNRWRITCAFDNCAHEFEPVTTLRSHQTMDCPRCSGVLCVDYNEIA